MHRQRPLRFADSVAGLQCSKVRDSITRALRRVSDSGEQAVLTRHSNAAQSRESWLSVHKVLFQDCTNADC